MRGKKEMSNSKLISYTKISPHKNPREDVIRKITIHHMAGDLSIERCGEVFQTRQASANYGVGTDGRIALYVEEKDRAWTSSSRWNDHQAVTLEVANDEYGGEWHVSDKAVEATIKLCIDICKRNNIKEINYTGDDDGNLTRHNMFAATLCPGPYLQSKFPYIAEQVNKGLKSGSEPENVPASKPVSTGTIYRVQAGAFSSKENAENLAKDLESDGFDTYIVEIDDLYKVQVGAFSDVDNAENLANKLENKGYNTFISVE